MKTINNSDINKPFIRLVIVKGFYSLRKLVKPSLVLLFAGLIFSFYNATADQAKGNQAGQKILPEDGNSVEIHTRVPPFSLVNQDGRSVSHQEFYGKVWVVNFTHTRCEGSCELQTRVMNGLQSALGRADIGKDIRHVTITLDPENDTPSVLRNYIIDRSLNTSRWHFLTGEKKLLQELIQKGFKQSQLGVLDNTNEYNANFIIVDWEGRIRGYYDVSNQAEFNLLRTDLVKVFDEQTAFPPSLYKQDLIDPREDAQQKLAKTLDIFTNFSFEDQIDTSGIRFKHKIVDDVGTNYKSVHYDHGNALAIADVDQDGLSDIYFTTLSGTNELWRNLGKGKFEDITERAGLHLSDRIGMGASFADIDNDGDPDLYISNVRVGNVLYENDGKGNFKDITKISGTGIKAHSSAATFFDYDRDGLLDLFVANVGKYTSDELLKTTAYSHQGQVTTEYEYYVGYKDAFAGHLKPERNEASALFRNLGNNRFEDVSQKVDLLDESWSSDAIVIDGNNDGWPDLYILDMQGNDEYYENQKGKRFVKKSREVFLNTPWGAMGARPFDYDNDGDMDIYVTDMHSDMAGRVGIDKEKLKPESTYPTSLLQDGGHSLNGNAFYRNDGDGEYTEISDQIGLENYWPWGPGSGDLNADGFEDLFVASSMAYPFRYSVNSVFLNDKGRRFIDSEYMLGVEPRKDRKRWAPWYEVDCAGVNKGHAGCNGIEKPGRTVVWGALGSRSSVIFDIDGDGDQDIVTLEFNHLPQVLISNLSEQKEINYLKVDLVGNKSNKGGLGAIVKVFAGEDVYTKAHDGKSGYLAQSDAPLYFGLGEHKKIDKIEVLWPSGQKQVLNGGLRLNSTLEVEEP